MRKGAISLRFLSSFRFHTDPLQGRGPTRGPCVASEPPVRIRTASHAGYAGGRNARARWAFLFETASDSRRPSSHPAEDREREDGRNNCSPPEREIGESHP